MKLNLQKPLLFFDIESTGLNIASDSIIELSFVKILPSGEQLIKTWRVRPWNYLTNSQKPIHPDAIDVHGITDEELESCPRFMDIVQEVLFWIGDSDLAGFNSAKFDLPLLAEEIERVRSYTQIQLGDINLHEKRMVDVQNIFHAMEPRNLVAAYKFYCNADLENAHAAEADTLATYEVLKAQLDRYEGSLKNDIEHLSSFAERKKTLDYAGRLILNEKKEAVINFGKHKGKTAREVYFNEPAYFGWIDQSDFTMDTKRQFALLKKQFDAERRAATYNDPLNDWQIKNSINRLSTKFGK